MALDDVLNDGQAYQTTQHHDAFTQPPSAAITGFPSLTRSRQAGFPLEDPPSLEHLEAGVRHATQTPTTLSPPTHVSNLRPSFFR